jgi:Cu/Ag efflux protein CusF
LPQSSVYLASKRNTADLFKGLPMRMLIATLLATASIFSPLNSWAQSADVEATIKMVDVNALSLTLDDGKTYKVPDEFNFEGLKAGVKVLVFYTVVDGNRVVDDLEIVQ